MDIPKNAEKWKGAMGKSKRGRKVLENIRIEENVGRNVQRVFFDRLGKTYRTTMNCLSHMETTLASADEYALPGPGRDLGMELLIRFSRLARLPDQLIFKRCGVGFHRLVKNPDLINRLTKIRLGNRRGIVWAALEEPVDSDQRKGSSVEKVLDKLGVTKKMEESWYKVVYSAGDVGSLCHVPTVFDAGTAEYFRPADKDASSGMTCPCSGKGSGYPEYVHEKCIIDRPGITPYIVKKP